MYEFLQKIATLLAFKNGTALVGGVVAVHITIIPHNYSYFNFLFVTICEMTQSSRKIYAFFTLKMWTNS